MARSLALAVITAIALALVTSLGCEGTPDASVEAEPTCAYKSERNDGQCPCELAESGGRCPHAQEGTQAALDDCEGCPRARGEAQASTDGSKGCAQEHREVPAEPGRQEVCVGSDAACALAGTDGCMKKRASAAGDVASDADPVCGMTLAAASDLLVQHDGVTYHFCSAACRDRFQDEPGKYVE